MCTGFTNLILTLIGPFIALNLPLAKGDSKLQQHQESTKDFTLSKSCLICALRSKFFLVIFFFFCNIGIQKSKTILEIVFIFLHKIGSTFLVLFYLLLSVSGGLYILRQCLLDLLF